MICPRCGRQNSMDSLYCQGCGKLLADGGPSGYPAAGYPYSSPQPPLNLAGIGARFLAALIDGVVIGIPIAIISTALSAIMAVRVIHRTSREPSFNTGMAVDTIGTFFAGFGFIMIVTLLLTWSYFALLESSSWQGTIGKKLMGIQVTDQQGLRISLGRATLRLVVKAFLSGWFLIGYIMAFFTQKKQTLHDLIAGTLVLNKHKPVTLMDYGQQYSQQPVSPQQPPPYNQTTLCPACGTTILPNARFCSNCGRSLL